MHREEEAQEELVPEGGGLNVLLQERGSGRGGAWGLRLSRSPAPGCGPAGAGAWNLTTHQGGFLQRGSPSWGQPAGLLLGLVVFLGRCFGKTRENEIEGRWRDALEIRGPERE